MVPKEPILLPKSKLVGEVRPVRNGILLVGQYNPSELLQVRNRD